MIKCFTAPLALKLDQGMGITLHNGQALGISTKGQFSFNIILNIDDRFSQPHKLCTLNHPDIIEALHGTTDRINLNGQLHLLHKARMI